MDWGKAKTILIVALIVTNIFLIVTYGFHNNQGIKKDNQEALINLLQSKDIYLEVDIPRGHPDMGPLSVQYINISEEYIKELLRFAGNAKPIAKGSPEGDYKLVADDFLAALGLMGPEVSLGTINENGNKITLSYYCSFDNIPVDDTFLRCTFTDGVITDFDYYWIQPISISKKKLPTISASTALISLINQELALEGVQNYHSPIKIEEIKLVYWLDEDVFTGISALTDTAFPSWRIVYNQGQVKHVVAYEQQ